MKTLCRYFEKVRENLEKSGKIERETGKSEKSQVFKICWIMFLLFRIFIYLFYISIYIYLFFIIILYYYDIIIYFYYYISTIISEIKVRDRWS